MPPRAAIVQFPGSNCDWDALHAFRDALGVPAALVWHKETHLAGADVVVLPGGFSFGDYLRCGAIARFSPVMAAVKAHAEAGGLVLAICNGFQIACEAGLLPGALVRNSGLEFRCEVVECAVEDSTPHLNPHLLGPRLRLPIAHGEGNYRADPEVLAELEAHRQVFLRYRPRNPNGALADIAGLRNRAGNVFGLMPHPERVVDPVHPNQDGLKFLRAFLAHRPAAAAAAAAA